MTGQVPTKLPQNCTKTMKIKTTSLRSVAVEVVFSQYFVGMPITSHLNVVPCDGVTGMQW